MRIIVVSLMLAGLALAQKPEIHGPKQYGARPGNPFIYRVPATGERPMKFSATGLPEGLKLNAETGVITGTTPKQGLYNVTLKASNKRGKASREFRIAAGPNIALTPPMGWSTWYMAYTRISDKMVREQAEAMIRTGLADHGYSYINIDDGWNIKPGDSVRGGAARMPDGTLRTNSDFPDMNGLTDFLHERGLKAGIYISPGPLTCAHYEGSLGHEAQDLNTFVKWGFDFLKYDWCTYGKATPGERTPEYYKKPYRLMGDLVKKAPRDLVYNLCQYGMGDVWTWGREVGGNFWRTTGDIGLLENFGNFWEAVDKTGFSQGGKEKYAGPGGWNDPDNLLIGQVLVKNELKPVPLTLNEKRSYFTLWAMLASPLVLGCDMTKLDDETLAILTNDDVIDINQDGLGLQAVMTAQEGSVQTWTKKLEGGDEAVAIFNRGTNATRLRYDFKGVRHLTDLWRKVDYGVRNSFFEVTVPGHGVLLMRSEPR